MRRRDNGADGVDAACAREDNALALERVAERDRTDKRWGEVRLVLFGVGFHLTQPLVAVGSVTEDSRRRVVRLGGRRSAATPSSQVLISFSELPM